MRCLNEIVEDDLIRERVGWSVGVMSAGIDTARCDTSTHFVSSSNKHRRIISYHLHHLNSNSLLHLPNMKFASLALAVSVSALPAKTSGQNVHARSLRSPTVAVVVPTSNSDTERRLGRGDSEPQGNGPCNGLCNAYDNSGCRTSNK